MDQFSSKIDPKKIRPITALSGPSTEGSQILRIWSTNKIRRNGEKIPPEAENRQIF